MQLKPIHHGYTLVELLVSISIFAIIMLAATGAYFSFIAYSRQAQTTATVINSLFFAIDTIGREMRTGINYTCAGSCNPATAITFTDANGCTVSYAKSGGALVRSISGGTCAAETNAPLTDPSITISSLLFYVRGQTPGDTTQPMTTIVISGQATVPNSTTVVPFQIETGATQRAPDL